MEKGLLLRRGNVERKKKVGLFARMNGCEGKLKPAANAL
jgi:hypothetical protein